MSSYYMKKTKKLMQRGDSVSTSSLTVMQRTIQGQIHSGNSSLLFIVGDEDTRVVHSSGQPRAG